MKRLWNIRSPLISLLILAALACGFDISDPMHDSAIRSGIRFTLDEQYDSAISLFHRISLSDTVSPCGPFFEAAALTSRFYARHDLSALPGIRQLCLESHLAAFALARHSQP